MIRWIPIRPSSSPWFKRNELPIETISCKKGSWSIPSVYQSKPLVWLRACGRIPRNSCQSFIYQSSTLKLIQSEVQIDLDEGPNPHDELLRGLRKARSIGAARMICVEYFRHPDVFTPSATNTLRKSEQPEDPGLAQRPALRCSLEAINKDFWRLFTCHVRDFRD